MEDFNYQYFWHLFGLEPFWLTQIIAFVALTYACCVFGVVIGKMGRSPFLGFIFLLPYFGIVAMWLMGLGRWPQETVKRETR